MPSFRLRLAPAVLALASLAGCAASPSRPSPTPPPGPVTARAGAFDRALAAMAEGERRYGRAPWPSAVCSAIAADFLAASHDHPALGAVARYDAGVALDRCGDRAAARAQYRAAIDAAKSFEGLVVSRARVRLVQIDLAAGAMTTDAAIAELGKAVTESQYRNADVLVELARQQERRDSKAADSDGPDDFARAEKNLKRALAIDDGNLGALNQLALHYVLAARRAAGLGSPAGRLVRAGTVERGSAKMLDLALLVASQGIKRDDRYAPLHATVGIVQAMLGDLTHARASFDKATRLDPSDVDAWMNLGSIAIMTKSFAEAERAYEGALKARPDDYDATLGLALALRGQIDAAADRTAALDRAERALVRARTLDPDRPEAWFNLAILYESFRAREGDSSRALERAVEHYRAFADRAKGRPELADTVDEVVRVPSLSEKECEAAKPDDARCRRGRIFDIEDTMRFTRRAPG